MMFKDRGESNVQGKRRAIAQLRFAQEEKLRAKKVVRDLREERSKNNYAEMFRRTLGGN